MTTFDKRKDAYESKFARDEELRFKATSRRNKLLGLWAAEKLGKTGADAEAYAQEVMRSELRKRATTTCSARSGAISMRPACSSRIARSAAGWRS